MSSLSKKKFTEEQLQLAWCRKKRGTIITAVSGADIEILTPGIWNLEAGPDFLNAKLAIDENECTGSVEIHKKSSDWISHRHSSNSLYDNVILHVVAEDDTASLSEELQKQLPSVPVLILKPRFSADRIAPADKFPKGKCQSFFSSINDEKLNLFFRKAGFIRFYGKVDSNLSNMREQGINKTFTELLFDACGYKQNRKAFIELFSRLSRYEDLSEDETEAVIWGESGLMPDPVSVKLDPVMEQFVKRLWGLWWKIRKEPLPPIKWKHSGLRPMNFPERRIAAVTVLMKKLGKVPMMFFANLAKESESSSEFTKNVIEALKCSHSVWDSYINFTSQCSTPAAVLGKSRAEDICLNVVLPTLQAQIIFTDKKIQNGADKYSNTLPEAAFASMPSIQSNRILETAAIKWFAPPGRKRNIIKGAISQQGILHIYRNFCEDVCAECAECPLADLMKR